MRLLITGASGFVGGRLLDLLPDNYEVVCIGRSLVEGCAQFLEADLTDKDGLLKAAQELKDLRFDAVVHLAAYVPKTAQEDMLSEMVDANIVGTANILEVFCGQTKKIILGSTAEVYDQLSINSMIDQNTAVGPASYYGATKLASEQITKAFADKHGVKLTILRFSVMYGGFDQIARALPNFIRQALNDEPLTLNFPDTLRDYIHLDDVAESILCAIQSDGCGVLPIGSGHGISIGSAAKAIVDTIRPDSQIIIEKPGKGVDIVVDPSLAQKKIGFTAKIIFPQKIDQMIGYYRA